MMCSIIGAAHQPLFSGFVSQTYISIYVSMFPSAILFYLIWRENCSGDSDEIWQVGPA